MHLDQKGRGRALRAVWEASTAEVVAYMDVDLSTGLDALLPLVAALLSGHSDLAIGTRLAPGARVERGPRREMISRAYNLVLKAALRSSFSDAQCGFKAMRTDVARKLLPMVEDGGWFFDTELLVLAERNGMRIHEVPVDWADDPDSRVDVRATAVEDLKGVVRLARSAVSGQGPVGAAVKPGSPLAAHPGATGQDRALVPQVVRFVGVGVVSTVTFAVLFAVLFGSLGAAGADVVSLTLCGMANLAANRRYTFSARGRPDRARYYRSGVLLAVLPLVATLVVLAALDAVGASGLTLDLVALTGANLLATVARFMWLRRCAYPSQGPSRP